MPFEKKPTTILSTPPDTEGAVTVVTEEPQSKKPEKDLIRVKAAKQDGKVILWEKDAKHPGGECFIAGDDKEYDVYPTTAVLQAIADGRLLRVNWNS